MDQEARALFQAGTVAFSDARYDDALGHFRRAYELSGRPQLLYNIGLAADRLRRDAEALEAFEGYLSEVPDSMQHQDVEARVRVLRAATAQNAPETGETGGGTSDEGTADEGTAGEGTSYDPASDGGGSNASEPDDGPPGAVDSDGGPSLVGPVILGGVGLAGLAAAVVGVLSSDDCLSMDGARCSEERAPSGLALAVYGGGGLVALTAAVLWLVLGGSDDGPDAEDRASLRPGPRGLDLALSF